MALFNQLHNQFAPDNKPLAELSEQEIIRIEKKLKAEVKLGSGIDLNEAGRIVFILRNHAAQLKTLYTPAFSDLRRILLTENTFIVSGSDPAVSVEADDAFRQFIEDQFTPELKIYASRCMQADHYNGLSFLLKFYPVLSIEITDDIAEKSVQKLEYATECMTIGADNLESRLTAILNPHFFRCLNKLGAIRFENSVIDLYNTCIHELQKKNRDLFFRALYAIGFYEGVRADLNKLFSETQRKAFNQGVRELKYIATEKNQPGGTYSSGSGISSSSSSGDKNNSSMAWGCGGGGVFVVVILAVIRIAIIGARNNNNHDYANLNFHSNDPIEVYDLNDDEDIVRLDTVMTELNGEELFIQSDEVEIDSTTPVEFSIENSTYEKMDETEVSNMSIQFLNSTEQPIIILFETGSVLFLEPDEAKRIFLRPYRFAIYTGENPERITYTDSNHQTKEAMRFGQFSDADREILEQVYETKGLIGTNGYEVTITRDGSSLNLSLEKIFQLFDDLPRY